VSRQIKCCIDFPLRASLLDYAVLVKKKKWPAGMTSLRVRFLDGDPAVQARVVPFAQVWSDYCNITFVFGDDRDAEIRVSFKYEGSWSSVGIDALDVAADEPTMNFGWLTPDTEDEEYSRVVTHEFGHALGLIHEHQSPAGGIPWNKAKVYESYSGPPNNWSKEEIDVNMFPTYTRNQTNYTKVDKDSIMMYPIPAELTDGKFVVGWNRVLSATDKEFIASVYPKGRT
jgi:hypothetical protein